MSEDLTNAALAVVSTAAFGGDVRDVLPTYHAMVRQAGESATWVALHTAAEDLSTIRGWTGAAWYERLTGTLDVAGWAVEELREIANA